MNSKPRNSLRAKVGLEVNRLRDRHGLTLSELSRAAGISLPTLIRIEKGRSATSLDILESLARELGETPEALLGSKLAPVSSFGREVDGFLSTLNHEEAAVWISMVRGMMSTSEGESGLKSR